MIAAKNAVETKRTEIIYRDDGCTYKVPVGKNEYGFWQFLESGDNENSRDFLECQTHMYPKEKVKGLASFSMNNWMEDRRRGIIPVHRSAVDIQVQGKLKDWYDHSFALVWGDSDFVARYTDIEKVHAGYKVNEDSWDDMGKFNHCHYQLEWFRIELSPIRISEGGHAKILHDKIRNNK
jgi:hypothetical protein